MITIYVKNQEIAIYQPTVVENTINYQQIQVLWKTSAWEGLDSYVHLRKGDVIYDLPVFEDGKTDKFDLTAGEWEVYLHGNEYYNGEVLERVTTQTKKMLVTATGMLNREPFSPIPPSDVEMLLAKMGNFNQLITPTKDNLIGAINDAYNHGGGGGSDDGVWLPNVDADGNISWERSESTTPPTPRNIKGAKGDKGAQGERGEKGEQGERGEQGEQGIQGERGADGAKGDKGDKGDRGEQGIQGVKGDKGDTGADGYTPVKGVDYFTDADIAEIVADVLSALPMYEGGSY